MLSERRAWFAIILFILIGVVGVPVGIHQWVLSARSHWICYSKHGHVLETVAACKFNLFSGLVISMAALAIGLYQMWKRR